MQHKNNMMLTGYQKQTIQLFSFLMKLKEDYKKIKDNSQNKSELIWVTRCDPLPQSSMLMNNWFNLKEFEELA